jgi:hypothetical protein
LCARVARDAPASGRSSSSLARMSELALIHPRSLAVEIAAEPRKGQIAVPFNDFADEAPVAARLKWHILFGVLYPAIERRDRQLGRTGIKYKLLPPDPWLVVLGTVMWQGIVQGMSWDAVKYSVSAALRKLRAARLAPQAGSRKSSQKSRTRIGFAWTEYTRSEKRMEMFVGLERVYRAKHRARKRAKKSLEPTRGK